MHNSSLFDFPRRYLQHLLKSDLDYKQPLYVKDVEDGKKTYTHIFAHNFLNIQLLFNPQKVLES